MKLHFKRTRMLLGLFPIISVIFFMLTANGSLFADQVYKPIDVNTQIVATRPVPEDGTTPLDYSAQENFAMAADIISKAIFYRSVTNGEVVANVGIKYVQTVLNTKYVSGKEIFAEAQSLSSLKKVAEQKFFSGNKILHRAAAGFSGGNVSWSDKIVNLAPELFATRYGVIPREICKYNVDELSVAQGEYVGQSANEFTYKLTMKPELSTQYIKNEIRTMGGAKADPTFSSNVITFTIDENWTIKNIISQDNYRIELPGLGAMSCASTLNEAFYDINAENGSFPPVVDDFRAFVPPADGGDTDIDTPKGPSDYLAESFAEYINGKPLYLAASSNIFGNKIDLRLAVDIANMDIRGMFNDNFFAYANDNVYFDIQGNKGYLSMAALQEMMQALDVNLDISLGDDILTTLFENSEIVETEDSVHIIMPFELAGYKFEVDMGLKKVGDTTKADTIVAVIDLSHILPKLKLKVNVNFVDSVTLPSLNGFECLDGITDFVEPIKNTVSAKSWDMSGNANIKTDSVDTSLGFNALVSRHDGVSAQGNFNLMGQTADFAFADGNIYASLKNLKFKLNLSDIPQIAQSMGVDLSLAQLPDVSSLTENLNIDFIFSILSTLKLQGNTLSLTLPLPQGSADISLSHNNEILSELNAKVQTGDITLSAYLKLNGISDTAEVIEVNDEGYCDVKRFTAFVPAVTQLLNAKSISFDYALKIQGVDLYGTATINLSSTFSAKATFNFGNTGGIITVIGDKVYVKLANAGVSASLNDVDALMKALGINKPSSDNLPNVGETINKGLGAISFLGFEGDDLKVIVSVEGTNIVLSLKLSDGLPKINAQIQSSALNADANVSVSKISDTFAEIAKPNDNEYIRFADLIPFIKPIMNTATSKGFELSGEVDLKAKGFDEKLTFTADISLEPTFSAKASLRIMEQTADIVFANNRIYFTLGNIKIESGINDIKPFIDEVMSLLNVPSNTADIQLPKFDIDSITSIIAGLKIDGLSMSLPINLGDISFKIALRADENGLKNILITDLSANGFSVNANINLDSQSSQGTAITPAAGNYVAVSGLKDFIAPIKNFMGAKAYEINITSGSMSSPFVTGNLTGRILVTTGNSLAVAAELNVFDHIANLYFVDNTVYLQINDIKVKVSASDIGELEQQLKKYIPQLDLGTAVALPTAINEIIDMGVRAVSHLALTDGRLTLGLSVMGLDVMVSAQKDLQNFTLDNLVFGDVKANGSMTLAAYPDNKQITVLSPETYVSVGDMLGFIDPVVNTVTQGYYTINASGKVYAADGKLTDIKSASLKVKPTAKFIDAELKIVINDGKRDHSFGITIIDGSGEKINADAYLDYNGMKFTINYHEALKILGAVKDILKLNIPMLDNLIADVYVPLDTKIFETMSIAGLDDIRKTINDLFAIANDLNGGNSQFEQILNELKFETIDKILKGIKLSLEQDGALKIEIKNEIFGAGNTGTASVILNKNETSLTRLDINNLMAQTNTVNFAATLDCSPFEQIAAPQNAGFNFNSINNLLVNLVDTANLGEFHIKGAVKLNIIKIINTTLNFEIKVKLVNGKPLVSARLDVPYFVAMLDETTNYLFYYDNNIYIKREQVKSESVGFLKWRDFQYNKYVKCTASEFLANPTGYLFFMVELPGWVQNQITGAMGKGTPADYVMKIENVLKSYEYSANNTNGNFGLTLNLAELSGNTDLADMDIDIGTSVPGGHSKQYISTLNIFTTFVKVVDLGVTASLQSFGVDIGNALFGTADSKGATITPAAMQNMPQVVNGWTFGNLASPHTVRYQLN